MKVQVRDNARALAPPSLYTMNVRPQHQVFVNFRGDELRCGFVSHLVEALKRHGTNVFIDKFEKKGEDLTNLFVRIEESTIALVIFSRRYTESTWCLDELVKIKQRADQGLLKVIPIFFKVEPVTVKQLRGAFGDQFRDRVWEYRCDKPRVQRWKEALASLSCKIGLTFNKKSKESKFVRIIVNEVDKMIRGQEDFVVSPSSRTREGDVVRENSNIANQIQVVSKGYMELESENSVLRAQIVDLRERLQAQNSIIDIMEGAMGEVYTVPDLVEGVMGEVYTVPHFLTNPWQMSYSSQPTLSPADTFYF
ncbi:unnamed protein product [Thlaspi arvense]|uniref:TIR domain-containing protein n=1 Tax=Thlaspi arvense TaxID=13288 RepID=A0AAU9RPC5_THLAR|nr:unnamed protein product [Thlaspi arvense]